MKAQINYLFSQAAAASLANTIKTQFGWSGDLEDVQQEALLLQLEHPEWEVKYIFGAIKKGALQAAGKSAIASIFVDDDSNDDGDHKHGAIELVADDAEEIERWRWDDESAEEILGQPIEMAVLMQKNGCLHLSDRRLRQIRQAQGRRFDEGDLFSSCS